MSPKTQQTEQLHSKPASTFPAYSTQLFLTADYTSPLNTTTFTNRPTTETPGNVAVCISGGGSRAFSAGIGQLQALEAIELNGSSLLNQVRAITTVSGGGWIGIPFTFLPASVSDPGFLGSYTTPSGLAFETIGDLPPQGIAQYITSDFSLASLAVQAAVLYEEGASSSMLWQILMGQTFLKPYGLYVADPETYNPTSLFSYDAASLATYVTDPNPTLGTETAALYAQVSGQTRPYLVSISGLKVMVDAEQLLAPVQSTPFATGIFPTPPSAVDNNGRQVGGGAVCSFAFNSDPIAATPTTAQALQSRQWSLTDALGTSSAAFAEFLISYLKSYAASPTKFAAALAVHGPGAVAKLARSPQHAAQLKAKLDANIAALRSPVLSAVAEADLYRAVADLSLLESIVPAYQYWSVVHPPTTQAVAPTDFTDGGSLENTGVASALSYADITSVIAFLNVETPLTIDHFRKEVKLDTSVPPLFGYQPYSDLHGYQTYADHTDYKHPIYQHNQVFASEGFAALQQGLWAAAQSGGPAVFAQTLTTVANDWFGVPGGTQVSVIWVYLNYASNWYNLLDDALKALVDFEYEVNSFPNYSTMNTQLSGTQINLLSNFTCWVLQESSAASTFTSLFTPS